MDVTLVLSNIFSQFFFYIFGMAILHYSSNPHADCIRGPSEDVDLNFNVGGLSQVRQTAESFRNIHHDKTNILIIIEGLSPCFHHAHKRTVATY